MNYDSTTIYDVDLLGEIDSTGKITQYYGKEAVANSIKLWLTSFRNDILRTPGKGGYLTNFLFKPMTDTKKSEMVASIRDGFAQEYSPTAIIKSLDVTPDYTNNKWIIDLTVYVDAIKSDVTTTLEVNNLV